MTDEDMVRAAIAAAADADPRDVPVGAVVFDAEGRELARASNARAAPSPAPALEPPIARRSGAMPSSATLAWTHFRAA